ncbi:heterokaryon incompatibility protein-domain-containing protein [Apiospora arundinis]|uniref:Heterokaryon incompatibility protein-domain-containing protein n=1 Tax=Apiospora arundinis TaxID=335852 RepID=A0ABR2JNZ6_9PEZI
MTGCPMCKTRSIKGQPTFSTSPGYKKLNLPSSVLRAAKQDSLCPVCKIVWRVLEHCAGRSEGAPIDLISALTLHVQARGDRLWHDVYVRVDDIAYFQEYRGSFAVYINGPDIYDTKLAEYRPIPAGSPDEVLDIAAKLVSECRNHHPACGRVEQPEKLQFPLRLIDVSCDPPRLREFQPGEQEEKLHPYIALSHCWGNSQPLRTLIRNISSHSRGIPLDILSPTYKDAVRVCQRLGISYLWIDSLCIIQDSDEDWGKQSSQMWAVYANAEIVVAAARDVPDGQGFLGPRMPFTDVPLTIDHPFKEKASLSLVYRLVEPHRENERSVESRGWTLQESISATRYLVFGTSEVSWRCHKGVKCECGISSDDPDPKWRWLRPDSSRQVDPHAEWRMSVVLGYSTRQLTKSEDVLFAVSGLAQQFHARFGGNYLAGLWQDDLLYELAWSAGSSASMRNCYMPSWTWASVTGVMIPDIGATVAKSKVTPFVTVVDAWTRLATVNNPFGHVTDAAITLRGVAVKLKARLVMSGMTLSLESLQPDDSGVSTMFATFSAAGLESSVEAVVKGRIKIELDTPLVFQRPEIHDGGLPTVRRARHHETRSLIYEEKEPEFLVWIVPLFSVVGRVTSRTEMTGIIVTPSETKQGSFERIALFRVAGALIPTERDEFERLLRLEPQEEITLV